jgi:hypothetical protein
LGSFALAKQKSIVSANGIVKGTNPLTVPYYKKEVSKISKCKKGNLL